MRSSPTEPTWRTEIDGRGLAVFDGLMDAQEQLRLWSALKGAGYTRSEMARPDTADVRHWATDIPLEALGQLPVYAPLEDAVAAFAPGKRYRPYRSYVNVAHYGDMLYTHTDCLPGDDELTALWYVCDRWDHEWGGETVFFDERRDLRSAVLPRPGRLALFDGAILHAGRPPNRNCHASRFTFALKLERAD